MGSRDPMVLDLMVDRRCRGLEGSARVAAVGAMRPAALCGFRDVDRLSSAVCGFRDVDRVSTAVGGGATALPPRVVGPLTYGLGMRIAVVGAHLSGGPLNHQLTSRGATFVTTTRTAPVYRLFALPTEPPKPGLLRVAAGAPQAGAVDVEVWELEPAGFGSFVDEIPSPLGIGRVLLEDGTDVAGFVCEPFAIDGADEITHFGGWRAYRAASPG